MIRHHIEKIRPSLFDTLAKKSMGKTTLFDFSIWPRIDFSNPPNGMGDPLKLCR